MRSKPLFSEEITTYMINAENNLNSLPEEENADTARRLEAAKKEKEYNWSAAAMFDAASALALSNATIYTENKDLNTLTSMLEQKTAFLQKQLSEGKDFAWAQLYLDHANYYLKGIYFYKSRGMNSQALEMAKSGVSIAFLAEGILEVSKKADAYYSSVPAGEIIENNAAGIPNSEIARAIIGLTIAIIIIAALFFFVRYYKKAPAKDSYEAIQNSKARLDSMFAEKQISFEKYLEMHSILENRLQEIGRDRASLSKSTVKADKMRFELQALRKTVFELQKQKKQGIITKKDFEKNSAKISAKIGFLRKAIAEDEKDIAAEKSKIKKELVDYSEEAKEIVAETETAKKRAKQKTSSSARKKGKK